MSDIVISEFYKRQAKDLTNLLFDKGFLADDLTRESIDWLEDFLGFTFQSQAQTAEKCAVLMKSLKGRQVSRKSPQESTDGE